MPDPYPHFTRDRLPPGVDPTAKEDPEQLGAFRIVGRIGAGGMGAVYAGLSVDGACSAVKVIHPRFAADPDFRARFAREVGMVSRVRAVCTPAFQGADVQAATPWLATEYVPGQTLRQHVRQHGPLTGGMLTALATGLAEALAAIHDVGVVHRDLKPGNVILAPDGPKVVDFGIARAADGTALTATGGLMGTPGWTAPERYDGEEATGASDMFAWGGLVAYAATGRDPFGSGAADALAHRVRNEDPDLAGVPEDMVSLVRRALDRDPSGRPTAVQALTSLASQWNATRVEPVGHEPTEIVPGMLATEWRGIDRLESRRARGLTRRVRVGALTAVAAAALALIVLGAWLVLRPGPAAEQPEAAPAEEGSAQIRPEDAEAVVEQARDLALDASSFLVHRNHIAERPLNDGFTFRYTEDPEPVYLQATLGNLGITEQMLVGEGLDDVLHRSAQDAAVVEGATYRGYTGNFHRPPDPDPDPDRADWADPAYLVEGFDDITGADGEVEHLGQSRSPDVLTNLAEEIEGEREVEETEEGQDTVAGQEADHYTGSFVSGRDGLDDVEHTFDLWIDEEGYPLHFRVSYEGESTQYEGEAEPVTLDIAYLGFDMPLDIEVPEESELDDPPEA
ncbi:protein kinase domain-containing protein [Nocardiopsis nanhaiensis]